MSLPTFQAASVCVYAVGTPVATPITAGQSAVSAPAHRASSSRPTLDRRGRSSSVRQRTMRWVRITGAIDATMLRLRARTTRPTATHQ